MMRQNLLTQEKFNIKEREKKKYMYELNLILEWHVLMRWNY